MAIGEEETTYRCSHHLQSLLRLLHLIQGRNNAENAENAEEALSPSEGDSDSPLLSTTESAQRPQKSCNNQPTQPHRRYIEARISPSLVEPMLNGAGSAERRAAWVSGLPVDDAPHCLRVSATRAVRWVAGRDGSQTLREALDLHELAGTDWWEQRAMECDGGRTW